ncbi:hypothetical protein [Leifsonia sp. Leaf264]|uniref:hypothetical protein n=1 Tax=Leifsonia sp. Leaf264 TaxID=1736314 RepID=UPI0006F9C0E8|nr:hypothetical protein [Leifsonia sp. Leaf264]KQO98706.1 hypothetical protein ASF30_11630 [Leifsonia sp. Leaf264]
MTDSLKVIDRPGTGRFLTNIAARKTVLSKKDGIEVSIPNIIVAVTISLAIIASVILGVIVLVPWAQQGAATSDLSTVQTAEQLYASKAGAGAYGDGATLVSAKSILDSKKPIVIRQGTDTTTVVGVSTPVWCAGIKSADGKYFWATSASSDVTDGKTAVAPTIVGVTCPAKTALDKKADPATPAAQQMVSYATID